MAITDGAAYQEWCAAFDAREKARARHVAADRMMSDALLQHTARDLSDADRRYNSAVMNLDA